MPRSQLQRRRLGLWCIALLALLTAVRTNSGWPALIAARIDHCPQLGCDFFQHYLPQARVLLHQRGVVVPGWLYPPLLALLLQPLVGFDDAGAWTIWLGLQLVLAACLMVQCQRVLRTVGRWTSWVASAGLVGLSLPVLHSIKWGQVSLLVAVIAIWTLQRRDRVAAALLGLLAAIKIYPAFYVAVLFARDERGNRVAPSSRVWFWAAFAVGLGAFVPLVILGPHACAAFARRLWDAFVVVRAERLAFLGGQALRPALIRDFANGAHTGLDEHAVRPLLLPFAIGPAAASVLSWLFLLPGLVVAFFTWRRLRRGLPSAERASVVMLAVGLAVSPGWHHYFAFLPFAFATLFRSDRPRQWLLAGLGFAATAVPVVLLADVPSIYSRASAWGCTTLAALLTWLALVVPERGTPSGAAAGITRR